MSLILNHGPAGSGKTNHLLKTISETHLPSHSSSFVLLVPPGLEADYTQALLNLNSSPVLWGKPVLSFDNFLFDLFKKNTTRVHRASLRILRLTIQNLLHTKDYPILQKYREFDGVVDDLAHSLLAFKQNGLTPEKLLPHFSDPTLRDVLALYRDLNRHWEERFYADHGDAFIRVMGLLKEKKLLWPEGLTHIYIDRIFPLSPGQREFLRILKEFAPGITVTVNYDFDFASPRESALYTGFNELGEIADTSEHRALQPTERVTQVMSFPEPLAECAAVMDRVQELLEEGFTPDQITLICPASSFYIPYLEKKLEECGIPVDASLKDKVADYVQTNAKGADQTIDFLDRKEESARVKDTGRRLYLALAARNRFEEEWAFEAEAIMDASVPSTVLDNLKKKEISRLSFPVPRKQGLRIRTPLDPTSPLENKALLICGFSSSLYAAHAHQPFFTDDLTGKPAWLDEVLGSAALSHLVLDERLGQAYARANRVMVTYPFMYLDGKPQSLSRLLSVTEKTESMREPVTSNVFQLPLPQAHSAFPKLRNHKFSVSDLDTYLTCPYQYYARRHLKLGEIKEEEIESPPDVMGNLIHRVFQELYRDQLPLYLEAVDYDLYLTRFIDAAQAKISEKVEQDAFFRNAIPLVREAHAERIFKAVSSYIKSEVLALREERKKTKPKFFEWPFGTKDSPGVTIKGLKGDILLTGRIDRIDVDPQSLSFTVIDYKTGSRLPSIKSMKEGKTLQIPVYIRAASALLAGYKPAGGVLAGLAKEDSRVGLVFKEGVDETWLSPTSRITHDEWIDVWEKVEATVIKAVGDIHAGIFEPKPVTVQTCFSCAYRMICHYEDQG